MNDASASRIDGKYALLLVLALGVCGAGGAWWYRQGMQRRPLELWGAEAAGLMVHARDVEVCRLEPATDDDAPAIRADDKLYQAIECLNAERLPGFLHLRHSLLNDHSFAWEDAAGQEIAWRYAIRFRDGEKTATLLISKDFRYALLAETGAKACVSPIAIGIEQVIGTAWTQPTARNRA